MSIPARLAGKFIHVLGSDAAEDLVNWMDEVRADHAEMRNELRWVRTDVGALRAELAALAKSMDSRFDKQNERFDRQDEKFDKQNEKFEKLLDSMHGVSVRVENLRGNFIAWNAAFWLTAIAAIVGLLQLLER